MKQQRWMDAIVSYPDAERERYRRDGLWAGRTIAEEFHESALRWPDAVALIGAEASYTYAELDLISDRLGAGFLAAGFVPGDSVLLQVENTLDTALAWWGLLKAALIPVATLIVHRGHEIRQIGEIACARGHIVQADITKFDLVKFAHKMAAEATTERRVLTLRGSADSGELRVEDLGTGLSFAQARAAVVAAQAEIEDDDPAVFQLSGGTTGTPKVIPRLHGEYWYNATAYAQRLGWDTTVRLAQLIPLVHNAGVACGMHAAFAVGGAAIICSPDADTVFPMLAEHGMTDLMMFPGMLQSWQSHPLYDAATASLRRVVITGAAIPEDLFLHFEQRGIQVIGLYGTGEGLIMATWPDDPPHVRNHTVGFPISAQDDVRIIDPDSETELADGLVGELCVLGPYTIRGYLSSPDRNAEAFTSSGHYRSGDLAKALLVDGVRYYTFEGRIKELVSRGGEKVNSAEIEGLVSEIPRILRAALVPVPDERLGERACLCVELEAGAEPIELSEIVRFLEQREVARYKWPERLEIFATLPRTEVGKIDKKRIRSLVLAQL